jgi:hypothetical protein
VVARDGFWCRPCFDYCIFDEPYCLRAISVEEVYDAASQAILLLANETTKKPRRKEPTCSGKVSGTEQAAD